MKSRFSIATLFMFTAAAASGFLVFTWTGGSLDGFCLGALTAFIATGLAQQILLPPEPAGSSGLPALARRLALGLILVCLAMAVYRTQVPYVVPSPNDYGDPQESLVQSSLARPLWLLALFLGSMTAPGMAATPQSTAMRGSHWTRLAISATFLFLLFCYVVYLVQMWAFIPALVDLGIEGMKFGMYQGPAVGTNQFVERFGKSPGQLQEFVHWQILTWPVLVLSLVMVISQSRSSDRPDMRLACVMGCAAVLAAPAAINAGWLLRGPAHQLFPELAGTYWHEPRPDFTMIPWLLLLISLYATTRCVVTNRDELSCTSYRAYWSDRRVVGWLFVAIGIHGLLELFEGIRGPSNALGLLTSVPEVLADLAKYILASPEYCYTVFFVPYGAVWLWRQRKSRVVSSERWPQIRSRQLLIFPCSLILLAFVITLCIPFGIATLHFWI